MPSRKESGRDRRGSSGSGRSTSGGRSGKPFKRSRRDAGTSSPKAFGEKKRIAKSGDSERGSSRVGSSRGAGRDTERKRDSGRSHGTAYKKSGRDESASTSRPYGAKRSAKPAARPYRKSEGSSFRSGTSHGTRPDSEKKSGTRRPYREGTEEQGLSKKSRFASDKRKPRTTEEGQKPAFQPRERSRGYEDSGKARGASFGKPYKKTYKPRPEGPYTSTRKKKTVEEASTPKSDKVRLNKFIANSGIASRREADELITMGLISVNGKVVSELGYKVSPGDEVRYEDRVLRPEKPVYVLMNKPKGFLTTTDDPQERKTVMHIVGSMVKERIYPVGRLDRNTTGLLLLTNDGELADKLMHPSFNVKKVYKVELDKPLTKKDFQSIRDGVRLEEGRAMVDDLAIVSDDGRTVGIELHIGWNRVVRRIFEALGYEVVKLDRTVYAGLDKKELGRGQWRFLTKEEIIHLKHFN